LKPDFIKLKKFITKTYKRLDEYYYVSPKLMEKFLKGKVKLLDNLGKEIPIPVKSDG